MKKYVMITLGCKVNQAESDAISALLKSEDFIETDARSAFKSGDVSEDVSLCIINTCTVTEKASMQSRQAVRRAIRQFPNATVIVTGCYAQIQPKELQNISGVHSVVGHSEKFRIPHMINPTTSTEAPVTSFLDADPACRVQGPLDGNKTRAFLKIQDGCNAACTYCIVPKARGKSRSMPQSRVLKCIERLSEAGYREVVLSGIHLGTYGADLEPRTTLTELLFEIAKNPPIERIRLSSIEPKEITNDIIQLMASGRILCRHFHIPLQSGDDTILLKMARPYSSTFFRELVTKILEEIPGIALGTDVLVGFPGETDDAYENTRELIASLPFSYLHVFPYSPRQKTPASHFEGNVPTSVIKKRCDEMRHLGQGLKMRFFEKLVGKSVSALIESGPLSENGYFRGRTDNYVPVYVKGKGIFKNSLVKVRIEKVMGDRGVSGALL